MMYYQTHDQMMPHTALGGVKLTPEGKFVPDWKSSKLPDYYDTVPYSKLSGSDKAKADKFYQTLSKLSGRPVKRLYDERGLRSPGGLFNFALMDALQAVGVAMQDSECLANATTGGLLGKDFFGNWKTSTFDADDYEDPEDLRSIQYNVILADALRRLRKTNLGAHDYIVSLIGAKAALKKTQEQLQTAQERQKMVSAGLETGAKVVQTGVNVVKDVAQGAANTLETAGFFVRNWPYILGGTVLVVGYLLYRNRETVGKVAKAAALSHPASRALALKAGL